MSDKFYVGQDLVSFSNNGKYKPISRVTLMIDDENCVTAGDDTGKELVATCYHATQAMADALLAKFKGYEYPAFEAGAANLNPAAELGDGLTADGHYVTISRMDDDGSGYLSPSAPGEAELEDEYPSAGPMTQEFNRKIAQTNSRITKTAEEIRQEVANEVEGLSASFTVQLDNISAEIVGLENAYSEMELSLDGLTARIQDAEGNIADLELTTQGFEVSIEDLEDGYAELALTLDGLTVTDGTGTTRIKGSSVETETLYVDAAHINGTLKFGQLPSSVASTNEIPTKVSQLTNDAGYRTDAIPGYIQNTCIDATSVETFHIKANKVEAVCPMGSEGTGFILTSAYGNKSSQYLRIFAHNDGVVPITVFESPLDGYATWAFMHSYFTGSVGFSGNVQFTGAVNFSNADVSGLTPKLAS